MVRPEQIAADGRYYDTVAAHYDDTRRVADFIWRRLARVLPDSAAGPVLDVGCGTGNYTMVMADGGRRVIGLDRSSGMLMRAKRKKRKAPSPAPPVHYVLGDSAALAFPADHFAAVVHVLCLHHFVDPAASVREGYRVLQAGGRACWFTYDVTQVKASWIAEYFPEGIARESHLPAVQPGWLERACRTVGFRDIETERVREEEYGEGCMNYLKHHPERALDAGVRANISFFARMTGPAVEAGVVRLRADLASGAWWKVAERARKQNEIFGDYLFVSVTK